jgi:nucleoid DNA-binding protein
MGNTRYCLTKADLADAIYAAIDIDKQKAADIVEDYVEIIKEALDKEAKVMLSGFGCYEVKSKPARRGRNPQTRETIILRARRVVKVSCFVEPSTARRYLTTRSIKSTRFSSISKRKTRAARHCLPSRFLFAQAMLDP